MLDDALAQRLAALSPERRVALDRLLKDRGKAARVAPELRRRPPGTRVPLAPVQERLWWLDQFLAGNPAYNETNSLRLNYPVDMPTLRRAVNEIVRRHETLRMSVEVVEGTPWQRFAESLTIDVPLVDLTRLRPEQREQEALARAADSGRAPFDLATGPLLRATVFKLGDSDFLFVLTLHHIVCDGWSMGVFMVEFVAHYWSFRLGKPSPVPELPVQYGDYVLWRRAQLDSAGLEGQLAYWRTQLADLPTLRLPADHPRPSEFTYAGARCPVEIGGETYRALVALAERRDVTMHILVLAAFVVLLHRYTEQNDIAVGAPFAGRTRRELEPMIGFFVNTLLMRVRLPDDATFPEVLEEVRRTAVDAYAHQDVPFHQIVDALRPQRDKSRNPLYQVSFQLFARPAVGELVDDVLVPFEPVASGSSKTDLELDLILTDRDVRGHLEFNTDLFDRPRIERMVRHLGRLLQGIVANPGERVTRLPLLTDDERETLLELGTGPATPFPRDRTLPQLFAEQAERTPDATALRFGGQTMSYAGLRAAAGAVAAELVACGVERGDTVGLYGERCLELPAAALGILAAGAAYVPLEPGYPAERNRYMLQDSGAKAVVTFAGGPATPDGFTGTVVTMPAVGRRAVELLDGAATDVACVMYTSGTTGQPKGVAVTHRNMLRLVMNVQYADLRAPQTFLGFAAISFDASTFELWGCLLNGGTLAIHPTGTPSPEELGSFIREQGVTVAFLATPVFAQLVEESASDLRGVPQVLAGGEALQVRVAQAAWRALPRSRILNVYGPTECTTYATTYAIGRPETLDTTVPIGRPIDNTTAYVLDRHGNLMPFGVPGELCLGGDGIAAGYWNRPALTRERFVSDPFGVDGKLYRTGDVAFMREDGEIVFLGRRDRQVKISGFRVELEEIEAAMRAHPDVRAAAVIVTGGESRRLEAFYEVAEGRVATPEALRDHLGGRLPVHMVPARLEAVTELPLTRNGKVDLEQLSRRTSNDRSKGGGYLAPRTRVEHELAKLWSEVLNVDRVGVRDDFFDLGGHSLVATRLLSRVCMRFDADVTMRSFFEAPTIEDLARQLR